MLNELYQLSEAMERAGITGDSWHSKYKALPNVRPNAPCIYIVLSGDQVDRIETVDSDTAVYLRKYGSNQGTFPAMNLAPLYRIPDKEASDKLGKLLQGDIDRLDMDEVKNWCTETAWGDKFRRKYVNSMSRVPKELRKSLQMSGMSELHVLKVMNAAERFQDPEDLHRELKRIAFLMLEQKYHSLTALQLLFTRKEGDAENSESLSVIFGCTELEEEGWSTASARFTQEFNHALLQADAVSPAKKEITETDAFGVEFQPLEETMPSVKLAGGFDVTLRTMFRGQPCQKRYGRIENESYPISPNMRLKLQEALNWISSAERKGSNWINTGKNEILFAYQNRQPQKNGFLELCKKIDGNDQSTFESAAKKFFRVLQSGKEPGRDSVADRLHIFVLRKIDKARTKIVYTYNTTPVEIERCSERWSLGCKNLPKFPFRQPGTLYFLDVADILSWAWKQNGTLITDKFRPVSSYHGLELLFGKKDSIQNDMHILVDNFMKQVPFWGRQIVSWENKGNEEIDWGRTRQVLALLAMFLFERDIRKEYYMDNFPFLYGQLLKVGDELHMAYCRVERSGEIPSQLAGNRTFHSAAERPCQTLGQFIDRLLPYVGWAKSYSNIGTEKNRVSIKLVGYYLSVYEKLARQLQDQLKPGIRFTDFDKAQFGLGYLAALPKKETKISQETVTEKTEGKDNE